jgi:hypothetical protein
MIRTEGPDGLTGQNIPLIICLEKVADFVFIPREIDIFPFDIIG